LINNKEVVNHSSRPVLRFIGLTALFALAYPSNTDSFDFRHFNLSEGMTLSISRSSPPLAAIDDILAVDEALSEKAPPTKEAPQPQTTVAKASTKTLEPEHEEMVNLKPRPGQQLLVAGQTDAWRLLGSKLSKPERLSIVAVVSRRRQPSQRIRPSQSTTAEYEVARNDLQELSRQNRAQVELINVPFHSVDESLKYPRVERSLPKGEVPVFEVTPPRSEPPAGDKQPHSPQTASEDSPSPSMIASMAAPTKTIGMNIPLQQTHPTNSGKPAEPVNTNPVTKTDRIAKQEDRNTVNFDATDSRHPIISGQIEMIGGLAVLGEQSQIEVRWKGGGEEIEGEVSQSTGEFRFAVPRINAGKIYAYLRDEKNRVIGRGEYDLEGAASPEQKTLQGVSVIVEPMLKGIKGRVKSAYSTDGYFMPVVNASVSATTANQEQSNEIGEFQIAGLSTDSTYLAEVESPDYWGLRALAAADQETVFTMFSSKMIQSLLDITGNNTPGHQGVVWGEIRDKKGRPLAGAVAALSTAEAMGPIYFNALGIPDTRLRATTDNGLFAFVKVRPGLHVVMSEFGKTELPSAVVSVSNGYVTYARIRNRKIQLTGQVIDAVTGGAINASVALIGSSAKQATDSSGHFKMTAPASDPVVFIETKTQSPEYYLCRQAVSRSQTRNMTLQTFKKSWLEAQLKPAQAEQDPKLGLAIGIVGGSDYNVTVDNELDYNDNNIFYFNEKGMLEAGRPYGLNGGGFVLTNLRPGVHTIIIHSAQGDLVSTKIFVAQKGVLNVITSRFTL